MANLPNAFIDDAAVTALDTRVPLAVTGTGMYHTGSNAPGIGIATDNAGLEQSLFEATDGSGDLVTGSWTLLDQHGDARNAQISQLIGGSGIVPRSGNVATTWDKSQALYTPAGAASSGGSEGTAPDATVRLWANPDNVEGQPNNDAVPTAVNSAILTSLATGWVSGP